MERAERMVLLGVGLAFDVLVPVLWVMLVLTAITAVHRFVMVWRQATPGAPRSARAPRADRSAPPSTRTGTVSDVRGRAAYLAYRAGADRGAARSRRTRR